MTVRDLAAALLLSLLPFVAGPAAAQGASCDAAATQVEMNACAQEAWKSADKELNAAYRAAVAWAQDYDQGAPDGRAEATLRAAQRAWIAYRDAACEAEAATWDGGTGQPMALYSCLANVTTQRTDDLVAYGGR